jgi:hypothetical protein
VGVPIFSPSRVTVPLLQDALKKLNEECESAFKCALAHWLRARIGLVTLCRFLRQQTQTDPVVLDFASRYSTVSSDIRHSVSSKWNTVRRCVGMLVLSPAAAHVSGQLVCGQSEWSLKFLLSFEAGIVSRYVTWFMCGGT